MYGDAKVLKNLLEADEPRATRELQEALDKKEIGLTDFSYRELFRELCEDGASILNHWDTHRGDDRMSLLESGVNSTSFLNISGQLLVNEVHQGYQSPDFIGDQLVTAMDSKLPRGEKIPGLSRIGNEAEAVGEGKPYPLVGFGEDWLETPEAVKRGLICPVTREAIVGDLTGLIKERANEVGDWLGYNREIRILQCVLGIVDSYNRRSRGVIATYGDNSGTHDFDNLQASNALVDWTDVENVLLLFDGMTDPNTGTPIRVMGEDMRAVVPTALAMTASRVFGPHEVRYGDGASNTTATYLQNPAANKATVLTSPLVKVVTSSATTWFMGAFKKGFRYAQISPLAVVQAPVNSEMEFTHDIVQRVKASEWGVAFAYEPRYAAKSTG